MPFDGSGTFTRVHRWQDDRDNGIRILADRHDAEDDNFATAFNQTFLRTGIVPMTGNLSMNGNNIVGIKGGTAASPSLRWELDPMTGFYQPAPQQLAISINGIQRMLWTATGGNFDGNIITTGNVTVGGTLSVTGTLTGSNATLSGTLNAVNGSFTGQIAASTGVFSSSISATSLVTTTDEGLRMRGAAPYFSWYNAAGTTRLGYMQHTGTHIVLANEVAGNIQFNNYLGVGGPPATQFHAQAAAWPTLRLQKSGVGFWDVGAGQGGGGANSYTISVNGGAALQEINTDGTTRVAGKLGVATPVASTPRGMLTSLDTTGGNTLASVRGLLLGEPSNNAGYHLVAGIVPVGGSDWQAAIDVILGGGGGRLTLNPSGGAVGIGKTPVYMLDIAGNVNINANNYLRIGGQPVMSGNGTTEVRINMGSNGLLINNQADNATMVSIGSTGDIACRDLIVSRGSSGAIFFTAAMDKFLYWDNVKLNVSGMSLYVTTGSIQTGPGVPFVTATDVWNMSSEGVQRLYYAASNATYLKCGNSAGTGFYFRRGDDAILATIGNDGNVTATNFTATSDERTKHSIRTVDSALDKVLAMRGVLFKRKSDDSEDAGVIAQELLKVAPELVHTSHGVMSVNYGGLSAYLIQAINELARKL